MDGNENDIGPRCLAQHLMVSKMRRRARFKRRWPRYGMRSLLGAMLAVVLLFASIERWLVRPYREQQRAIAVLDAWNAAHTEELQGPAWLRWIAPEKYFLRIIGVDLHGKRIADESLQRLVALPSLRRLNLHDIPITDAELEPIGRMKNLREINLAYTRITDAGLEHLARLQHLQKLHLFGTTVSLSAAVTLFERRYPSEERRAVLAAVEAVGGRTESGNTGILGINLTRCYVGDAGLAYLAHFPELERLNLTGTLVSGSGSRQLDQLTNLRLLMLSRTQFSDAGLERLEACTRLETLGLGATLVTDAGLEHLKRLQRLRELELYYTRVTDAGLDHLKALTGLAKVDLVGTRVTDEGIDRLQAALPNTEIIH